MKKKINSSSKRMAVCAGAVVAANAMILNSADAAMVAWGSSSVFDDATDVINNGNVVEAVSHSAATVNGVSFTADATIGDFATGGDYADGFFMGTTGDAGFDALVGNQSYENTGDLVTTITLTGLTLGTDYTFQFFIVDDRSAAIAGRSVVLGDLDGGTASASVARGLTGGLASGNTITGAFTGDADGTQEITVTTTDGNGALTGYVLSSVPVPEPSSTALLGLGGLALILRRRK